MTGARMTFRDDDWPRARAALGGFDTLDLELPWAGDIEGPSAALADDVWLDELAGVTAPPAVAAHAGCDPATFARYVRPHLSAQAPSRDGKRPRASLATMAAHLGVPILATGPLEGGHGIYVATTEGRLWRRFLPTGMAPQDLQDAGECAERLVTAGISPATLPDGWVEVTTVEGRFDYGAPDAHAGSAVTENAPESSALTAQAHARDVMESREVRPGYPYLLGRDECFYPHLRDPQVGDGLLTLVDDGGRELDDDNPGVAYELRIHVLDGAATTYTCARAGEDIRRVDRHTGADGGAVGTFEGWYGWILDDVAARRGTVSDGAPRSFDGDGFDALLERTERGIVSYDGRERLTATFATSSELQTWLDEALASSSLPVRAWELDSWAWEAAHPEHEMLHHHSFQREEPDVVGPSTGDIGPGMPGFRQSWVAWPLHPWLAPRQWYRADHPGSHVTPGLHLRLEGPRITEYDADLCTTSRMVEPWLTTAAGAGDRWFVLTVPGTQTVVAFPRDDTMLRVSTDQDGAQVRITAEHVDRRLAILRDETGFNARWVHWLDPERPLSTDETTRGIAAVEGGLAARIAAEADEQEGHR